MISTKEKKKIILEEILEWAEELVKHETNPDEVTRWHSVMQQINRKIEEKMIKRRKKERE